MELARTTGSQDSQKIICPTKPLQETTAEEALMVTNCCAVPLKQMQFANTQIGVGSSVKKIICEIAGALITARWMATVPAGTASQVAIRALIPAKHAPIVIQAGACAAVPGQPVEEAYMNTSRPGDLTLIHVGSDLSKKTEGHRLRQADGLIQMKSLHHLGIQANTSQEAFAMLSGAWMDLSNEMFVRWLRQ